MAIATCYRQISELPRFILNNNFVVFFKQASTSSAANHWDDEYVKQQIILLELTESLKVITGGLPHRISYKEFVSRYQCLTCKRICPSQSIDYQELSQVIQLDVGEEDLQ